MKELSIPEICDKICELEAYIEYLQDKLKNHWSNDRQKDRNSLKGAYISLKHYKQRLNA